MCRGTRQRRRACLEDRLLATLKQAMIDSCLNVAEHLLRTFEALVPNCEFGSPLARAYLLIAEPKGRKPDRSGAAVRRRE
jgi:hypothetical protein